MSTKHPVWIAAICVLLALIKNKELSGPSQRSFEQTPDGPKYIKSFNHWVCKKRLDTEFICGMQKRNLEM
jgi:hypothetical protein